MRRTRFRVFARLEVSRRSLPIRREALPYRSASSSRRIGQLAVKLLADEPGAAACDVDQLADEVRVDPCDKVVEIQVDVFHARTELCRVVVTQAARIEIVGIGARLDERAARLRHLLAVHRQEAMRKDAGRRPHARAFENGRPEQGMEIDDVLADEMVGLGVAVPASSIRRSRRPFVLACSSAGNLRGNRPGHPARHKILVLGPGISEAEVGRIARDVPVLQDRPRTTPRVCS